MAEQVEQTEVVREYLGGKFIGSDHYISNPLHYHFYVNAEFDQREVFIDGGTNIDGTPLVANVVFGNPITDTSSPWVGYKKVDFDIKVCDQGQYSPANINDRFLINITAIKGGVTYPNTLILNPIEAPNITANMDNVNLTLNGDNSNIILQIRSNCSEVRIEKENGDGFTHTVGNLNEEGRLVGKQITFTASAIGEGVIKVKGIGRNDKVVYQYETNELRIPVRVTDGSTPVTQSATEETGTPGN